MGYYRDVDLGFAYDEVGDDYLSDLSPPYIVIFIFAYKGIHQANRISNARLRDLDPHCVRAPCVATSGPRFEPLAVN